MTKIAYNNCFGGFSLSRKAVLRARELSGNPKWGGACIVGDIFSDGTKCRSDFGHIEDVPRHDPFLIQVIEELGDEANGNCADLAITDVPSSMRYRIDEYDGNETVATPDDYNWEVAP